MEIISKVLSRRMKIVLPFLISSNHMAYVKKMFINEGGRVISDTLAMAKALALGYLLVT